MKLQQEIIESIHQTLQIDCTEIQPQDNLIEYGLHSLAIMQLVDTFEKKYKTLLSYSDFAMTPTVADWVNLIAHKAPVPSVVEQKIDNTPLFPSKAVALSDMQYAYWSGRQSEQISAHLYMEFSGSCIDIEKLNTAYQQLIIRHPMLTVAIVDGLQAILAVPQARIQLNDLRDVDSDKIADELKNKRQQMSHQLLDIQNGQVFDLQLTLLPQGRHIVHVDSDMVAIDPQSFLIVIDDLTSLYLGKNLQPLNTTGFDYFTYLQHLEQDPRYQQQKIEDKQWWQQRLQQIAPAPDLPYVAEGLRENAKQFERLVYRFDPSEKQKIQQICAAQQISVRALCLGLFAETIATWSTTTPFRLNLPFFIRKPDEQNLDKIVGDFTYLSLLDVEINANQTILELAKAIDRNINERAEHYRYGGIHVLRDLAKLNRQQEISPIVFTSALDIGELFTPELQQTLGTPMWCISQGQKVDLDVQVAYFNEGLVLNWDIRRAAFKPHVMQAMFKHYIDNMKGVLTAKYPLSSILEFRLPELQSRQRKKIRLSDKILNQFPFTCENTTYRIVNALQKDCPNWVVGKLWLSISSSQLDAVPQQRLHYINQQYWYDTDYDAYCNGSDQIVIDEDKSQWVRINGYRIELSEIVNRLHALSGIQQVKLYSISSDDKTSLVAILYCQSTLAVDITQLLTEYSEHLPQYLIPEHNYLIDDKQQFKKIQRQNLPDFMQSNVSLEELISPQHTAISSLEKVIFFMMCKMLGLETTTDYHNVDFFDYGGDSLLATHFVGELNQYFKECQISVVDIFSQRTVKQIAQTIENNLPQSAQKIAEVFLHVMEQQR